MRFLFAFTVLIAFAVGCNKSNSSNSPNTNPSTPEEAAQRAFINTEFKQKVVGKWESKCVPGKSGVISTRKYFTIDADGTGREGTRRTFGSDCKGISIPGTGSERRFSYWINSRIFADDTHFDYDIDVVYHSTKNDMMSRFEGYMYTRTNDLFLSIRKASYLSDEVEFEAKRIPWNLSFQEFTRVQTQTAQ